MLPPFVLLSILLDASFSSQRPFPTATSSIMKITLSSAVAVLLASCAVAAPTPTATTVEKRASTFCGQWDSVTTGAYTLYNNLWGESSGSGSQCTTYTSLSSNVLKWSTSWSWSGGSSSVKSYANARITVNKALSAISKIPSTWNWRYVFLQIKVWEIC